MQNDHNFENFQNSQNFENSENPAKHTKIVPTVPVSVPVTETVKNNVVVFNRDKSPTTSPFSPPTLEEVQDYCFQRGNVIDPLRFFTYYSSRGWMMGKTPMTDWRAAIQWWEQRDEAESRKAPTENDEPVHWLG